jgi:hypothetical protein
MSLEIFGDEGDVPECAEDTAMYQELLAVHGRLYQWKTNFDSEIPNEEVRLQIDQCFEQVDALRDLLKEALKP